MSEEYGITSSGFNLKRLDTIKSEVNMGLKDSIGIDPSENPQSVLNIINTIFCDQIAECWEKLQGVYLAMFPNTAEGVPLDNVMQIGGISRIGKSKSKYYLSCTGVDGTVIPSGTVVKTTTQPTKQLQCSSIDTISRDNWRRITLRPVDNITGSAEISYKVQRNATSGEVGSGSSTAEASFTVSESTYAKAYSALLEKLKADTTLSEYGVTVSECIRQVDGVDIKEICLSSPKPSDSFSADFSSNVSVGQVTSNILFETVDYGDVQLASGIITEIVTVIDGFNEVTNEIAYTPGRLAQTDSEFRSTKIQRIASLGDFCVDAIVASLYNDVTGVSYATGYHNDEDLSDSAGRPPHSIEIVVQGGDDIDVANVIFKKKPPGIHTHGSHYAYATDSNGDKQYVEFSRVNDTYLLLYVEVSASDEALDDDYIARIQNILCGEKITAGENIRLQTFYAEILDSVSGVDSLNIKGALSANPDISSFDTSTMKPGVISVGINQQPVVLTTCIKVVKV